MRFFLLFLIVCVALSSPKAIVHKRGINWRNVAKVGAIGLGTAAVGYLGYKGVKHLMNKNNQNQHEPMSGGQGQIGQGAGIEESFEKKNH